MANVPVAHFFGLNYALLLPSKYRKIISDTYHFFHFNLPIFIHFCSTFPHFLLFLSLFNPIILFLLAAFSIAFQHFPLLFIWLIIIAQIPNEMKMDEKMPIFSTNSHPLFSPQLLRSSAAASVGMRKHSVSAQLTRTARRFSTVIAPQLTKLEPIPCLQRHHRLRIRIGDIQKLQEAIKQYVLHNGRLFDPVEFEIRAEDDGAGDPLLLSAQFYAEEIVLYEGSKRLLSISLTDPSEADLLNRFNTNQSAGGGGAWGNEGPVLAKVRHPISGIKMFEVVQSQRRPETWQITGAMDELSKCEIKSHSNIWRKMLSACGFVFASEWWSVQSDGFRVAQICPQKAVCEENSLRLEWNEQAGNELRLLSLCFGLVQTVREAFPSLMHIVKEARQRKMQIHRPSLAGSP